jgi:hypothetical protein
MLFLTSDVSDAKEEGENEEGGDKTDGKKGASSLST